MNYFGMVSTNASKAYTPYAVDSFFRETPLEQVDAFYLIDNDNSLDESIATPYPKLTLIRNQEPLSFAKNANQILHRAKEAKADLFFLNNDLIFSKNWLTPLVVDRGTLLSPISNRECSYVKGDFRCELFLALEDYLGKENDFAAIVSHHQSKMSGYQAALSIPFFCIKIPYSAYTSIGYLDETFGLGGAEDNDYCLRAYLTGIKVEYALSSYILHFSGRSTWNGGETPAQARKREQIYQARFVEKWGEPLRNLIIRGDSSILLHTSELQIAARTQNFKKLIELLQKS